MFSKTRILIPRAGTRSEVASPSLEWFTQKDSVEFITVASSTAQLTGGSKEKLQSGSHGTWHNACLKSLRVDHGTFQTALLSQRALGGAGGAGGAQEESHRTLGSPPVCLRDSGGFGLTEGELIPPFPGSPFLTGPTSRYPNLKWVHKGSVIHT